MAGLLPTLIASASIDGSSALVPLGLVTIDVRFAREVTVAGRRLRHQSGLGRVLRTDEARVVVLMLPLGPRDLAEQALALFAREGDAWTLQEYELGSSDVSRKAPFAGLDVERAAASVRLERHRAGAALEGAVERLQDAVSHAKSPPGFAFLELGLGAAMLGKTHEALAMLARAIELGCPELPTALAVRASLRLREGDLDGAEADVAALGSVASEGVNDEGSLFPAGSTALHGQFLKGLIAAARADDDAAVAPLEATVQDALEAPPKKASSLPPPDGSSPTADGTPAALAHSTLDPSLSRAGRGDLARRALAAIAARRGERERALEWLEPLDTPADHLQRGGLLRDLGREVEAIRALERARDGGNVEASSVLMDMQRHAALKPRSRPEATDESGFDLDDRIAHDKFGLGTIVDVDTNGGRAVRVTVAFDDGTTRTLPGLAVHPSK